MKKRLTIFVEGDTDKTFFENVITFLFDNAKKKKWDKSVLQIISLDGISKAEAIIKNTIDELPEKEKYEDTICLIYDTDAFEFKKHPPVRFERVRTISTNADMFFIQIPIENNIEDMVAFSIDEIITYLKLGPKYEIPKGYSGIGLLKKVHKDAGQYYIKGSRSIELLKHLNYSSICRKYCSTIRILCKYFNLKCEGYNLCKIRKKNKT